MIELRHQVPGRTRWHVPSLKQDPRLASRTIAALQTEPGIGLVRANAACGSLVVQFDPAAIGAARIESQLRELLQSQMPASLSDAAETPPSSESTARRRSAGDRLPQPKHQVSRGGLLDALGLRPAVQPPDEPSLLCRLNLKVTRWMLRTSLRAWWHEQAGAAQAADPRTRETVPSLSLAWAYQLSQPLLSSPGKAEETPGATLAGRLLSWWRGDAAAGPRLIEVSGERVA